MQLQFKKCLIAAGIIPFILFISLMRLSGNVVFAIENEVDPEPIASSEIATGAGEESPEQQIQAAYSFSKSGETAEFQSDTLIYLPLILQPLKNDPTTYMNALELAVLDLVNLERSKAGCNPVEGEPHLQDAAYLHSKDMADNNYFSHTGLNGSRFSARAKAAGYKGFPAAENIAAGYQSANAVMASWMSSPGHRSNILNCSHTHIGIGQADNSNSKYKRYWTQVFGQE